MTAYTIRNDVRVPVTRSSQDSVWPLKVTQTRAPIKAAVPMRDWLARHDTSFAAVAAAVAQICLTAASTPPAQPARVRGACAGGDQG